MRVIVAPYAAKLDTGQRNPKNYPYWQELIALLNAAGHEVTQIGCEGEERIEGVAHFLVDWPLDRLCWLINQADLWISVDSFLSHLCAIERLRSGVVLWGVSDDRIFGYPHNLNLTKDNRTYLRPYQFDYWKNTAYDPSVFISPEDVMKAIDEWLLPATARSGS